MMSISLRIIWIFYRKLLIKFIMRVRKVDSDAIKLYEVKVKSFAPRQIQRRLFAALVTLSRKVF